MTCEEAEENNFVLLCQEGEVKADVVEVEVECQLDNEVAQLTGAGPADDADLPDLDTFQVGSWVSELRPVTTAPSILYTHPGINNQEMVYHPADPAIRGGDWVEPQQKILFNKSATFPRQSQKCEETEPSESGLYYQGEEGPGLVITTVCTHYYSSVGGGDLMLQDSYHHHQYNYIQNFHAYRGGKHSLFHRGSTPI